MTLNLAMNLDMGTGKPNGRGEAKVSMSGGL